jgi:hypothetical protein
LRFILKSIHVSEISISTIHVADGRELGDSPQVFVHDPPKTGLRQNDTLLVFLDLPNASVEVCEEVAQTLYRCYYQSPGGITTGLRLAVRLACERLNEFNRGLIQPVLGSLSCAVISGENVVIGQSGPAIAYARAADGSFERITPNDEQRPIGVGYAEMYFVNFAWQAGDAFVLTGQQSISPDVSERLIKNCMAKGDGRMVAGYLNANVKTGHMVGIAFTVNVRTSVGELETWEETQGTIPSTAKIAQILAKSEQKQAKQGAHHNATQDGASSSNPPNTAGAPTPTIKLPALDTAKIKSALAPIGQWLGRVGRSAGAAASQAATTAQREAGKVGRQMLPGDVLPTSKTTASKKTSSAGEADRKNSLMWLLLAIALPVIVTWLVTTMYLTLSGEAERKQWRDDAQASITAASALNASPDLVQTALRTIADYQKKVPEDRGFDADRVRLTDQLDRLTRVTRVKPIKLTDLQPTTGTRRLAAFDHGVYVLDTGTNTAEQYVLNTDRKGIANKPVSLNNGPFPSAVRDISWATPLNTRWNPADGAMMFSNESIYFYSSDNGKIIPVKIPSAPAVNRVIAGELYNSQFYMLDAGAGQLWRYVLGNDSVPRGSAYFATPVTNLQDAIDVAIDGGVFVLKRNPQEPILRYLTARQQPFRLKDVPQQFVEPVAIASSTNDPSAGFIYVGDAKLGLIIQLNKDGEFIRQFRGENDEFVGMQDMSLDFSNNTMYVVSPNKLTMMKID